MDIEKTVEYYAGIRREDLCSCDYCQNLIDEIKSAYPDAAEYLSTMGADIEKPFEIFLPIPPVDGYMEYFGVQYLIAGDGSGFEETAVGRVSFRKTDSHPAARYKGAYFIVEAGPFRIRRRTDKYDF